LNKTNRWQGSSESVEYRPSIAPFLGLLAATAVGVVAVGFLVWFIPTVGLSSIHPALPYVTGGIVLAVALFILAGALFISMAVVKGRSLSGRESTAGVRTFLSSSWLRWMLFKLFMPLMVMGGSILRVKKITIERAFIDINNQMVRLMGRKLKPECLLILMPHCIQFDDCNIKVTRDVKNCAGCGRCEVGELVELMEEFGIEIFISTGGTVARRKVYEHKPDAVIAVACERDLTSGVQDAYPLPVLGIVNKRPKGYCIETGVEIPEVRQAILDLVS
jgi:hypothetical protein